MGVIDCNLHGLQAFIECCSHVGDGLRRGLLISRRRCLEVDACDACWDLHDLGQFAAEAFPEWSAAAAQRYDVLNSDSECHCVECVAAVELTVARSNGAPDPFPAYERTLTFAERASVRRLETTLLQFFDFQQSIVDPLRKALWIRHGALTHPLYITIYYVIDRASQDTILAHVAKFFSELPERQYRIRFYRGENWNQVSASAWSRGPEELLREYENDPPGRTNA